jgi:small subunit ribosomal protein S9
MSDNRQSLSDLGAALGQQREAAVAQSDDRAEQYLTGQLDEPIQRAPLREQ